MDLICCLYRISSTGLERYLMLLGNILDMTTPTQVWCQIYSQVLVLLYSFNGDPIEEDWWWYSQVFVWEYHILCFLRVEINFPLCCPVGYSEQISVENFCCLCRILACCKHASIICEQQNFTLNVFKDVICIQNPQKWTKSASLRKKRSTREIVCSRTLVGISISCCIP